MSLSSSLLGFFVGSKTTVNCWFCNADQTVDREYKEWWRCSYCEQFNGFGEDGDYRNTVPGMHSCDGSSRCSTISSSVSSTLSLGSRDRSSAHRGSSSHSSSTDDLFCVSCLEKLALKVRQCATFIPINPDDNDFELAQYKSKLEEQYSLCPECEQRSSIEIERRNRYFMSVIKPYAQIGRHDRSGRSPLGHMPASTASVLRRRSTHCGGGTDAINDNLNNHCEWNRVSWTLRAGQCRVRPTVRRSWQIGVGRKVVLFCVALLLILVNLMLLHNHISNPIVDTTFSTTTEMDAARFICQLSRRVLRSRSMQLTAALVVLEIVKVHLIGRRMGWLLVVVAALNTMIAAWPDMRYAVWMATSSWLKLPTISSSMANTVRITATAIATCQPILLLVNMNRAR